MRYELFAVNNVMSKPIRITLGVLLAAVFLGLAQLASMDCREAPYVYDDCMWLWLRGLGFPASLLVRLVIFECVGLLLAMGLYFTFKYVFRLGRTKPPDSPRHLVPGEKP